MTHSLTVAGTEVPFERASSWVSSYLGEDADPPYGYPWYDHLDSADPNRLADVDLLAPNLLNAQVTLKTFVALRRAAPEIEVALTAIPVERDLADATDDEINLLYPLFRIVEHRFRGIEGVQGTIFSKVLHRKRPRFIPLFDRHTKTLYFDRPNAPLTEHKNDAWGNYIVTLAHTMRTEISDQRNAWNDLAEGKVSHLRALDIIVWNLGANSSTTEATT